MILSVTVNPMVEHFFDQPGFHAGGSFRPSERARVIATGKPLNCTRALRDLGHDVLAIACIGGATGREVEECLEREDLPHRLIAIRGESRRGFTVVAEGRVTTVYGPPPVLRDSEVEALVATVKSLLPARLLVLGGSTPRDDVYARLACLGVPVVLDTRGAALENALKVGDVFLAKPNLRECVETFGPVDLDGAASLLHARGARHALITDGSGEALFSVGGRRIRLTPPQVDVVHTVGCGDALCAGFIHAFERGPQAASEFAMACGSYAATQPDVGRVDLRACERIAQELA